LLFWNLRVSERAIELDDHDWEDNLVGDEDGCDKFVVAYAQSRTEIAQLFEELSVV
jgi:hypothetical protein